MKKNLVKVLVLMLAVQSMFAQAVEEPEQIENTEKTNEEITKEFEEEQKAEKKAKIKSSLFFTLGLQGVFYASDPELHAPSPAVKGVPGISYTWGLNKYLLFQPHLSYYYDYYLWNEELQKAFNAELENRTAWASSFVLILPVVYRINLQPEEEIENQKSNVDLGIGVGANIRIPLACRGVTDQTQVDNILNWCWDVKNLLLVEVLAAYQYILPDKRYIGAEIRADFPASIFTGDADGIRVTCAARISLPQIKWSSSSYNDVNEEELQALISQGSLKDNAEKKPDEGTAEPAQDKKENKQ